MNRVAGKIALVTGGAKGIGAATARLLASEGARVMLTDMDAKNGKLVVAEIKKAGGDASFMTQDVTIEKDWERVIKACVKTYGELNVIVNNAGIGIAGTAEDTPLEDWHKVMSVNMDGVFLGTKHAIRAMKKNKSANSIVNISSIEGIIADAGLAAYNASKAAVRNFTKSAALHCAASGYRIRVNSVHPGYIWTPLVEAHLKKMGDVKKLRQVIDAMHPIGHMGEPDDIAYGVLYLASDESKFVTGSELVIDGGYIAR